MDKRSEVLIKHWKEGREGEGERGKGKTDKWIDRWVGR
jgi:hypothetical protein